MKLVDIKCPNCGQQIQINSDLKNGMCNYCGSQFLIDEQLQKVDLENARDAGYEFERGRQKAMVELELKNKEIEIQKTAVEIEKLEQQRLQLEHKQKIEEDAQKIAHIVVFVIVTVLIIGAYILFKRIFG